MRSPLMALVLQRCPRCRDGAVFSGLIAVHERCPSCGLLFEREHGYFTGGMVAGYTLGVPLLALLIFVAGRLTESLEWGLLIGNLLFVPLAIAVFRYGRVVWLHLDRAIDRDPDP